MKRNSWLTHILFFINTIFALLLLLAYVLPYLPPQRFPFIAVLGLGIPVLIVINILFAVYWGILLKRKVFLSLITLLIGFNHILALFNFKSEAVVADPTENSFQLMSYNVRQFNRGNWLKDRDIPREMESFIQREQPDVICFQEYTDLVDLQDYPYRYIQPKSKSMGQAIYSKFPIVNKGSLDFPNTANNVVYVDVAIDRDTLRIFNMHMQSLAIDPDIRNLDTEKGKRLTKRIGHSFARQQIQMESMLEALADSPYPNIISGDMNNTAFSYIYRKLTLGMKDAFKESGSGMGRTFVLDFIPLRIDFILSDFDLDLKDFKTYDDRMSDHYPIATHVVIP